MITRDKKMIFSRFLKIFLAALVIVAASPVCAALITDVAAEGGGFIYLNGGIQDGDTEQFRRIAKKYKNAVVVLNSNGGNLFPAIEIGKLIKISGFYTLVPDGVSCASSCALIWLAGNPRIMQTKGRVGFHAGYRDNNGRLEESGVANALIGNYLSKLNLSEKSIIFATTAPPDKIRWLNRENMEYSGIFFDLNVSDGKNGELVESSPDQPPAVYILPDYETKRVLPSYLPRKLTFSGEEWVKFGRNAYYDINSVRSTGGKQKSVWVIVDYKKNKKSKWFYSVSKYVLDCPNFEMRIVYETTEKNDGRKSVSDVSLATIVPAPGTAEKALFEKLCR